MCRLSYSNVNAARLFVVVVFTRFVAKEESGADDTRTSRSAERGQSRTARTDVPFLRVVVAFERLLERLAERFQFAHRGDVLRSPPRGIRGG